MNPKTPQLIRMKKWMRKTTINFFERNQDTIGAPGFVPISHKMIADIMATGFEVISRDTYFITCRARQILTQNLKGEIFQEDEIFKAERALHAHFEQLHEYFDTRIKQGEQKLRSGGFSIDDIQRTVQHYETLSVTNGVTHYLNILGEADYYISILQYLWVTGELSDHPDEAMRIKLTSERDVRQHLFGISRASTAHYNNIRRICNGVVEKRRKERLEQSERDRQRAAARAAEEASQKSAVDAHKAQQRQKRQDAVEKNALAVLSEAHAAAADPTL